MRGQLSVKIIDGDSSQFVTQATTGLRFRKTAQGGFHSGSLTLNVARDQFTDLGPTDKVIVTGSNGATVIDGYIENPGVTDGPAGQSYEISFLGGMSRASDQAERLIYLDGVYDQWRHEDYSDSPQAASGVGEVGAFPDDAGTRAGDPAVFCQFSPGAPVSTNKQAGVVYDAFTASPMTLGGFAGFYDGGMTDSAYRRDWIQRPYVSAEGHAAERTLSGVGGTLSVFAGGAFPAGKNGVSFRIIRTGGATNVATDNVWAAFGEVVILGHLVDRYGVLRNMATVSHVTLPTDSTSPVAAYVLASEVAEDLLGRLLTFCDPAPSRIDVSTAQIDQLAFIDPTKAADVFDALALHEPDYLWEVLEMGPTGRHRFAYRAWPTSPRYEISVRDGYNAPGGEVDLCNRIAVAWTDEKGVAQTTVVTSTVPQLAQDGRIRDADPITLPDGLGSLANAQRAGALVLASKNQPPKAGTATVRRPILDALTGHVVMPWEIEPGYLVRVRETGDDLRLTEMEYVDEDAATTLTLGTPVESTDQILARLSKAAA